jgi:hypothetical protein
MQDVIPVLRFDARAVAVMTEMAGRIASGHLISSENVPRSRRRHENKKGERFCCRFRRRNDSSLNKLSGLPPKHVLVAAEAVESKRRQIHQA